MTSKEPHICMPIDYDQMKDLSNYCQHLYKSHLVNIAALIEIIAEYDHLHTEEDVTHKHKIQLGYELMATIPCMHALEKTFVTLLEEIQVLDTEDLS